MVQPTISPAAADDAGCTATTTLVTSGPLPDPPFTDDGFYTWTGGWSQFQYDADPAFGWAFNLWRVTYKTVTATKGDAEAEPTTTETTATAEVVGNPYTRTPTATPNYSMSDPECVECHIRDEYTTEHGTGYTDVTRTIIAVEAIFSRNLPHGDILCNQSGVLVCNQSGNLLWN